MIDGCYRGGHDVAGCKYRVGCVLQFIARCASVVPNVMLLSDACPIGSLAVAVTVVHSVCKKTPAGPVNYLTSLPSL